MSRESCVNLAAMDTFKWRKRAKFIAYVDLVLAIVGMLVLIFNAIIIASMSTPLASQANSSVGGNEGEMTAVMHPSIIHSHDIWSLFYAKIGSAVVLIMSIATALGSIIIFVQMWAGIKLLKSTKAGREPKDALKMALFWRQVNLAFIALYVITFIAVITEWLPLKMFATVFVGFVIHIVFLYVVWQFIKELKGVVGEDSVVDEKKLQMKLDPEM